MIDYLNGLLLGQNLSFNDSQGLLDSVLDGNVPPVQFAAFLTAMRKLNH